MGLHHDTDEPTLLPAIYAPPSWRQLGVFVLDGATSMTWDLDEADLSIPGLCARKKAEAVDNAVGDFMNRMLKSKKAANFSFSFVSFNDSVTSELPPRDLLNIDPSTESFDPTRHGTAGTIIATGLESAREIVIDFLDRERPTGLPMTAVVLVMSDGVCSQPERTLAAAEALKQLPDTVVACSFFADHKDPGGVGARVLQAVSSGPAYYQTVFDAEQLRKFFMASMTNAARSSAVVPFNGARGLG